MRRPNTPDTMMYGLDRVGIKFLIPKRACDSFGLSCSYCEQGAPHPSHQKSDWSNKDWHGTKAKAREQYNSLIDFNDPKPKTNMEQTTDIDEVAFSKLQIRQSDPKEEPLEVTKSVIPPPPVTEAPEEVTEDTNREELLEVEKRLQREEEKYKLYNGIYVGQLRKEEKSDTDTDCSTYSYFK